MVDTLTPYEALNLAIDRLGTQVKMAELCGVSRTAVWKWVQSAKRLPPEHVLRVEAATGVCRHALAPNIYPRGLVEGVPYSPDEPPLEFGEIQFRRGATDRGADTRFHGVDRRAGAHV